MHWIEIHDTTPSTLIKSNSFRCSSTRRFYNVNSTKYNNNFIITVIIISNHNGRPSQIIAQQLCWTLPSRFLVACNCRQEWKPSCKYYTTQKSVGDLLRGHFILLTSFCTPLSSSSHTTDSPSSNRRRTRDSFRWTRLFGMLSWSTSRQAPETRL